MFIRRIKTRTTENGSCYYSFRLVDTYRLAGRVRQRTLLNLGSKFACPREQWPELTQRIERILQGQSELLTPVSLALEEQVKGVKLVVAI